MRIFSTSTSNRGRYERWVLSLRDGDGNELTRDEKSRLKEECRHILHGGNHTREGRPERRKEHRNVCYRGVSRESEDCYTCFASCRSSSSDRISSSVESVVEDLSRGIPVRAIVRRLAGRQSTVPIKTAHCVGEHLHSFLLELDAADVSGARVTDPLVTWRLIRTNKRVRLYEIGLKDLRNSTWNNFIEMFRKNITCVGSSRRIRPRIVLRIRECNSSVFVCSFRDSGAIKWIGKKGAFRMFVINDYVISCTTDDLDRSVAIELFKILSWLLSQCKDSSFADAAEEEEYFSSHGFSTFDQTDILGFSLSTTELKCLFGKARADGGRDGKDDTSCVDVVPLYRRRLFEAHRINWTAEQCRELMTAAGAGTASEVVLDECRFQDNGNVLAGCMRRNACPSKLCLRRASFLRKDNFSTSFCQALAVSTRLQVLEIDCRETDFVCLLEAVRTTIGLKCFKLYCEERQFRDDYWADLCDLIRCHPTLEDIKIRFHEHHFVYDARKQSVSRNQRLLDLAGAVRRNHIIKYLYLCIVPAFRFHDRISLRQGRDMDVASKQIFPVLVLNQYREKVSRSKVTRRDDGHASFHPALFARTIERICRLQHNQDLLYYTLRAHADVLCGNHQAAAP